MYLHECTLLEDINAHVLKSYEHQNMDLYIIVYRKIGFLRIKVGELHLPALAHAMDQVHTVGMLLREQ